MCLLRLPEKEKRYLSWPTYWKTNFSLSSTEGEPFSTRVCSPVAWVSGVPKGKRGRREAKKGGSERRGTSFPSSPSPLPLLTSPLSLLLSPSPLGGPDTQASSPAEQRLETGLRCFPKLREKLTSPTDNEQFFRLKRMGKSPHSNPFPRDLAL